MSTACFQLFFVTQFLVSPLTVANINTVESDGKPLHATAATEPWSSTSLPITGGFSLSYLCLPSCTFIFSLRTCSENVTSDCCLLFSEELCLELSRAIEAGDMQAASQHASALARQKAALTIQLSEKSYPDGEIRWDNVEGCFRPTMTNDIFQICAAHSAMFVLQFICSSGGCLVICVCHSQSLSLHDRGCTQATGQKICQWTGILNGSGFHSLTPTAVVPQVFFEYGFHPRVQRWVIGQCLCTEPRSLASYGVQKDGDTAYLYLISARQARLTRQMFQQDLESALLTPPLPPGNGPTSQDWRGYSTLPSRLPHNNQGEFNKHPHSVSLATESISNIIFVITTVHVKWHHLDEARCILEIVLHFVWCRILIKSSFAKSCLKLHGADNERDVCFQI